MAAKPNTPPRFAEGTEVSAERSRAELETLLRKHGASEIGLYTSDAMTVVQCRIGSVMLRQQIHYPPEPDSIVRKADGSVHHMRSPGDRKKIQEGEWRRRWRALVLVVKAKLELVASGSSTIEREFMADLLLADGQTMGDRLLPAVAEMYESAEMPNFARLMLGPGGDHGR